ncbi:cupin-like domain-containing protein [Sorangium sp. So ce281]|uniref:cupin-like domain-containing protein n=1 Tax=unclassified Sorangium TaxID=2621164 RepID=UPI003F5FFD59
MTSRRNKDVVLDPGEALFIPVGWWHHVRALDAGISLGINSFPFHNNFDWYRPSNIG